MVLALALAFAALSSASYRLVASSAPRPEVILVGAPDGEGRAMATLDGTDVKLRVWSRGNEADARLKILGIEPAPDAARVKLVWMEDSSRARLIDLENSTVILEMELSQ